MNGKNTDAAGARPPTGWPRLRVRSLVDGRKYLYRLVKLLDQ